MSNEIMDVENDYERGGLTPTDREYLQKSESERREEYSRQARSAARNRIRKRVRASLRDYRILANELSAEEREKIFAARREPRSQEYFDLSDDVASAIEFLYAGMGGESGFRRSFNIGVANGEHALENVDNALNVVPQFTIDRVYQAESREITDLIEAEEWNRLNPPDLFSFLRLAHAADAIDFDTIRDWLDFADWSSQFVGKKRRAIPGGKQTPLMDPDLYEGEEIGEMSGEELRDLFGEGYSVGSHVIYDGEKVIGPPGPGSEEEPEVIDWIGTASSGE